MSVLFSSILSQSSVNISAVYATVVGSNLGAVFSPIGALAGIMWSSILTSHDLKFGYGDFVKMGTVVGIPTLLATLGILSLVI